MHLLTTMGTLVPCILTSVVSSTENTLLTRSREGWQSRPVSPRHCLWTLYPQSGRERGCHGARRRWGEGPTSTAVALVPQSPHEVTTEVTPGQSNVVVQLERERGQTERSTGSTGSATAVRLRRAGGAHVAEDTTLPPHPLPLPAATHLEAVGLVIVEVE